MKLCEDKKTVRDLIPSSSPQDSGSCCSGKHAKLGNAKINAAHVTLIGLSLYTPQFLGPV